MCIIFTDKALEISFNLNVNKLFKNGGSGTINARIRKGKARDFTILIPTSNKTTPITATHIATEVNVSIDPRLPPKYRRPEKNRKTNPRREGRNSCTFKDRLLI
jgi:hypothetical protein